MKLMTVSYTMHRAYTHYKKLAVWLVKVTDLYWGLTGDDRISGTVDKCRVRQINFDGAPRRQISDPVLEIFDGICNAGRSLSEHLNDGRIPPGRPTEYSVLTAPFIAERTQCAREDLRRTGTVVPCYGNDSSVRERRVRVELTERVVRPWLDGTVIDSDYLMTCQNEVCDAR